MKRILFFMLISVSVFSQKTTETFESKKLGETREITIGLPTSYEKNTTKKYPIMILLDGDYLFDPFYGALNYGAYWDDFPEVIVVAISQNKNNERETDCAFNAENGLPEEKGEAFFEFIGQELIPYVDKKFRTAPFKMIAGHDLTATFLNFFLYKDQPIFDGYISLSPELATGMEEQIPERLSLIAKPIFYYQSSADGDFKKMQERIQVMDKSIKALAKPTLNYKFDEFKQTSHYSLVLQSIPSALYQFFADYHPISMSEFNEKIATLPSGYTDYLANKYEKIDKTLGIKIPIRVNDFKAIEAAILKNKDYNDLDALSILAKKNYPKAMLADYELGLMFEKKGDIKNAVKYYMYAFQEVEIGSLTKEMMINKAEDLKKTLPKKGKKGKEEPVADPAVIEEIPPTPEQGTPIEATPVEEVKKP